MLLLNKRNLTFLKITASLTITLGTATLALLGQQAKPPAAPPQDETQPTFRSDTRLVVCHATVVDKSGHLVTDLTKDSFTVLENGVPQPIKSFKREDIPVSLGLLAVACIGYGAYASNHWAISQTLAGPTMAGRWTSLQNGLGNLSGIAAPWLTGLIVQHYGSARFSFVITGAIALAGASFWGLLVRRVEPVQWEAPSCISEAA